MSVGSALARGAGAIAAWGVRAWDFGRAPNTAGTFAVPGLKRPVTVTRDRWGIPHIEAEDDDSLFFAQGYVHAQDRIWQMDLMRRVATGELAEMFGLLGLPADRFARSLGFRHVAAVEWNAASEWTRKILQSYSDGVNAFLTAESNHLPVEFALVRRRPRPWEPTDSLALAKCMAWNLAFGWFSELVVPQVNEKIGAEHASTLDFSPEPNDAVTAPSEVATLANARFGFPAGGPPGSNAWAIAPAKSSSGAALLASDPHLAPRAPSPWYCNHLRGGAFHVTGGSFPGTPGVLVGHNEHIAWGFTVSYVDAQDLFEERFHPDEPLRYERDGEWATAKSREERIFVKGARTPYVEDMVTTVHGPVVDAISKYAGRSIAIRAAALQPSDDAYGFLKLNAARNWDEFSEAVSHIRAAQLNAVYADVASNIGYRLTGVVPVRREPRVEPRRGWLSEDDWQGEVPFEDRPATFNPSRGFVLSANNRMADDRYPHHLADVWPAEYRAERLHQLLTQDRSFSLDDSRGIQLDVTTVVGLRFAKLAVGAGSKDPDGAFGIGLLRNWDGRMTEDSAAATVYAHSRELLVRRVLAGKLGDDLAWKVMGEGFDAIFSPASELFGTEITTVLRLLESDSDDSFWLEGLGDRGIVMANAVSEAVRSLRRTYGDDPDTWRWGKVHRVSFPHVLGSRPVLAPAFNLGPFPVPGDRDTPRQHGYPPSAPFAATSSNPLYRQIIDVGNWSRSRYIVAPGQSGRVSSPHYRDLVKPWLAGEDLPMLWEKRDVQTHARETLHLVPKSG